MRRFSVYRALYFFVIFYTIATMTQDLIPFVSLNRIFYFGIIACLGFVLFSRLEKNTFFCLFAIGVDVMLVHLAYSISGNVLDYIYFTSSLMWLLFMTSKERREKLLSEFMLHKNLNKAVIYFSVALTVFALITKSGYQYSWGSAAYYVGFSSLTHTAASSLCLVGAIILLMYCKEKFSWMIMSFLLILCYGIFETGARTYIISAMVIVYLYISKSKGDRKFKAIIYAVALALVVIILSRSSIIDKFNFTSNADQYNKVDKLTQQTSGRATFWIIDLKGFLDNSLFAKIFGHGHGYTYYLNEKYYHLKVWAHNDFIQTLVGGGLLTLYIYLSSLVKSIKSVIYDHTRMDKIMLLLYCIFPAVFNGFYNYSHYFLSFIVLCLLLDYERINRRALISDIAE